MQTGSVGRPAGVARALIIAVGSLIAFSTRSLALFVAVQVCGVGGLVWIWSVGETHVAELFPPGCGPPASAFGVSIGRIPAITGPLDAAPSETRSVRH